MALAKQTKGIQKRVNGDGSISFRAQIRVRGFPHVSGTFERKTDAVKWLEEMRVSIRAGNATAPEAGRVTLHEALSRYLREVTPRKKGKKREEERIKVWQANELSARFLSQLRGADFAEYRDARRAAGKKENTVRVDLALISHLYKVARTEWRMEGLKNPIGNITMPKGSNARSRKALTTDEETALMVELQRRGPYMAPIASLAMQTAMRRGELLALSWVDLDLATGVAKLHDTKNGEARDAPLSKSAIAIIKALPRQLDPAAKVFPISPDDVTRNFRKAAAAAGIDDLHFHDLRHFAVGRFFALGLNVMEVAAISGHKTLQMLKRYTRLEAADLARKLG